jgi:glycosyltransferase involved in cell wall biosynthesis
MKVCYWGTYERQYPRNAVLISGLRKNGVEVIECHFPLWNDGFRFNKLTLLSGYWRKFRTISRVLLAYPTLILRYLSMGKHDAVVVGYLGHIDVLFLAPFARLRQIPIIFDAFFSLYDTAISDWGIAKRDSVLSRLFHFLDRVACNLASMVLVDTKAQKEFFCKEFKLPESKVYWLYVGADDSIFVPILRSQRSDNFRVLYIGNYVPLHGVSVILEAARLLARENIEFWLVGDNHGTDPVLQARINALDHTRVRFFGWMPPEELRARIAQADVCFGVFGTSEKAKRVIPGKAFLALAMAKPLITGDSQAAREFFKDGETAILCETGNPHALASAVLRLRDNPALLGHVGHQGNQLFQTHCSPKVLGSLFSSLIEQVVSLRSAKMENL